MADDIDVSVLEQSTVQDTDEEDDELDEEAIDSLNEALGLLVQSRTMMEFLADPELCKTLTMRDRNTLSKLAIKVSQFLVDTENLES